LGVFLNRWGAAMSRIARTIESMLVGSRWLLAPFYIGLALSLFVLLYKFGIQFFELIRHIPTASEADVMVGVLGLIDISLVGRLVVIVIFSGYENFVSKLAPDVPSWPDWMTKVDFSGVKQKLLGSVVAIAAIQVLEAFMNIDKQPDAARLGWMVGIFSAFVGATLVLAIADRLGADGSNGKER
jgi:uncharacterized protein (TIGR00645 family)